MALPFQTMLTINYSVTAGLHYALLSKTAKEGQECEFFVAY